MNTLRRHGHFTIPPMTLHILALETSSARCGVALLRHEGGHSQLFERHHDGVGEHSEKLLGMVDAVLAEAGCARVQLDAVAFGQGPGGFTGLRVACGVAQGLAYALDLPLLPVITHQAMAFDLPVEEAGARLILQDARMDELYAALLDPAAESAVNSVLAGPVLLPRAALEAWLHSLNVGPESVASGIVGTDLELAARAAVSLPTSWRWHEPVLAPRAAAVATLGLHLWQDGVRCGPEEAQPLYVRDKVAFTTLERQQGAGGNPRAPEPGVSGSGVSEPGTANLGTSALGRSELGRSGSSGKEVR